MLHLKIRGITSFALAWMTSAAFFSVATQAQTTAATTSADNALQEIVVTAQKRAQSISDVGLTITALGNDALETQGVKSLSDLARIVPGLSYASTDFGTPVFTLRGVGFYDYTLSGYPTTSVYVDEVPLAFPVLTTHAALDLARVEVLKGPQGTLFGQNSTGGAINYIAAKPTSTFEAGLSGTTGRFGQGDVEGYISGPISDTLRFRLSGEHDFGDNWQYSYTRDDVMGQKDVTIARLLLEWAPIGDLRVNLNLNAWQDDSDPLGGQYIATNPQIAAPGGLGLVAPLRNYPYPPANDRATDWSPDWRQRAHKTSAQAALRADYDVGHDVMITSISSYVSYRQNQKFDPDSTTVEDLHYTEQGWIRTFTQELRAAGGEKTAFRWLAGGNLENSTVYEGQYNYFAQSTLGELFGSLSGADYIHNVIHNYAGFLNAEYDPVENLTFKAGARYTKDEHKAAECTFDTGDGTSAAFVRAFLGAIHPGATLPPLQVGQCENLNVNTLLPAEFNDTLKESNVSWHTGIDYKLAPEALLYVNVAKGYKAGGFPVVGTLSSRAYDPVRQESLLDYEGGFKARFFQHRLGLNGAVFYYDYTNKQLLTRIIDPVLGTIPALANIPKSTVKGAELEIDAVPIDGLTITSGATYLDAKITQYQGINAGGVEANFAGTPIPFTPKWQFSTSADYNIPIGSTVHPFIGMTVTGRTRTVAIVGSDAGLVPGPYYRSLVPLGHTYELPGYGLLDLRAGVASEDKKWRVWAWGKNVLDKYYWQNVVPEYDVITRYAGMPATFGVSFDYRIY